MKNRVLIALLAFTPLPLTAQAPQAPAEPAPPAASQGVQIELSAVECSFSPGKSPLESQPLAYADIEKLPAKSVKLLDRVLVSGKSGERLVTKHLINAAAPGSSAKPNTDAPAFAPGESGTIVELETTLGGDAAFCNVNISCQFQEITDASSGKTPRNIYFATSFDAKPDSPIIINVSSAPGRENTFIAIVARVHPVDLKLSKPDSNGKTAGDAVSSPKK